MTPYQAERFRRVVDGICLGTLGLSELIYLGALLLGTSLPLVIIVGVAAGWAFLVFETWLWIAFR